MVWKNEIKKCFDCKHKIVISEINDYDLGGDERVDYECIHSRVKYSFLANNNFNYELMANKCKYFEPKEYGYNCSICGETFKFKQPNWPYWTTEEQYGSPLCSQECVDEYNKESDVEVRYNPYYKKGKGVKFKNKKNDNDDNKEG